MTISPSLSLYRIVVLPAASNPTMRMRISFLPKRPWSSFEMERPICLLCLLMRRRRDEGLMRIGICFSRERGSGREKLTRRVNKEDKGQIAQVGRNHRRAQRPYDRPAIQIRGAWTVPRPPRSLLTRARPRSGVRNGNHTPDGNVLVRSHWSPSALSLPLPDAGVTNGCHFRQESC